MTNEELCLRYQAGVADAADELICRNMGLIRSMALRYNHAFHNARMDADDYTQEGAVALLRAAYQYDLAKQVPFSLYARQIIRNAIIDAIRADDPNIVLTPLDESHTVMTDDSADEEDLFHGRIKSQLPSSYESNPEIIYIRKEQLENLYAAISALSPRHHAWVICRYGFDDVYKSLAEMAEIYHLSEQRAKKTENEAVDKLRQMMNPYSGRKACSFLP